eukprot:COSAG01_NODE_7766_length_3066_cov_2.530502_2_plen_270_part_00
MPTTEEDRSHFHAWAVVSSPLVLGYDLRNTSITERIWPIISNRRAVQINQRWAGHPGRLVKAWDVVPQPPAPPGSGYVVAGSCSSTPATKWTYDPQSGHLQHAGKCMDSLMDVGELELHDCDDASPTQKFTRTAVPGGDALSGYFEYVQPRNTRNMGGCVDIYCARSPCGPNVQVMHCHNGPNQIFSIDPSSGVMKSKSGQCIHVSSTNPARHGGGEPGAEVKLADFSLCKSFSQRDLQCGEASHPFTLRDETAARTGSGSLLAGQPEP